MAQRQTIDRWLDGTASPAQSLWSDGRVIYSYRMPIAVCDGGHMVRVVCRSKSPSITTSRHIGMVEHAARCRGRRVHTVDVLNIEYPRQGD